MTEAAGEQNVWLVGGGELVGAFADEGLLDEVWLGLQPVFLGAGEVIPAVMVRENSQKRTTPRQRSQRQRFALLIVTRLIVWLGYRHEGTWVNYNAGFVACMPRSR